MKKLKLDENFPPTMVEIFRKQGIDASSIFEQNMNGDDDTKVFDVCVDEERILITFDLDFANIINFPSDNTSGILIVRTKVKINLEAITAICSRLAMLILTHDLKGKLFIVEDTKVRIRKPDTE